MISIILGDGYPTIISTKEEISHALQRGIQAITNYLFIITDNSFSGENINISARAEDLIRKNEHFDYAMIIGSPLMMKIVSSITTQANVLTYISLNSIMVEGFIICANCDNQININKTPSLTCLHGIEINAALIDWSSLENRLISNNQFLPLKYNCH